MEHCLSQQKYEGNQTMLDAMKEFFPDLNCFLFSKPGLIAINILHTFNGEIL